MSIFSRILKRGPEDGGAKPAEPADKQAAAKPAPAKPAAAKPAPPTREETAAPRPQAAPAAGRPAAPSPTPAKAVAEKPKPALAVTQYYQAAAKPSPAAAKPAAPKVAARKTPARGSTTVSPPAPRTGAQAAPARTPDAPAAAAPARPAVVMAVVSERREQQEAAPEEAMSVAGSLDQVFEQLFRNDPAAAGDGAAPAVTKDGRSTTGDQRTLMATFEELAVGHIAQVRSFMLEVRWGEAQSSWLALARPALKSLRAMASQVEHAPLVTALDAFEAAVAEALRPGAPPALGPASRDALLAAYLPLIAAMPRAFELDGERERREPIVVRALLEQVAGLDPLMIDRMVAAGLGRLDALLAAKADEIAVVAEVPEEIAAAVAARVQTFKRETPAALSAPDPAATARELGGLIATLERDHQAFEDASRGWSSGDRDAKKRLRRQREVSFLQIVITLARLGEVDLVLELQKLPFARRIEELSRLGAQIAAASTAAAAAPAPAASPPAAANAAPDYDQLEIEKRMDSGAHPAP